MIREGEDHAVKSVERELTVMFTDVVGFTSMAEGMEAGAVAGFLNHHFALLGTCVEQEGGTPSLASSLPLLRFTAAFLRAARAPAPPK